MKYFCLFKRGTVALLIYLLFNAILPASFLTGFFTTKGSLSNTLDIASKEGKPALVFYHQGVGGQFSRFIKELLDSGIFEDLKRRFTILLLDVSDSEVRKLFLKKGKTKLPGVEIISFDGTVISGFFPIQKGEVFKKLLKNQVTPVLISHLKELIEKDPYNPVFNYAIAANMDFKNLGKRIEYLKVAAGIVPDFQSPFTQKIYEDLVSDIILSCENEVEFIDENFVQVNKPIILKMISASFPDCRFKMKGAKGAARLIWWFTFIKDYSAVYRIFSSYSSKHKWYTEEGGLQFLKQSLRAISHTQNFHKLQPCLLKFSGYYKGSIPDPEFQKKYLSVIESFVYYSCRRGEKDKIDSYLNLYLEESNRFGLLLQSRKKIVRWACRSGFCGEKALEILDEQLKSGSLESKQKVAINKLIIVSHLWERSRVIEFTGSFIKYLKDNNISEEDLKRFCARVRNIYVESDISITQLDQL